MHRLQAPAHKAGGPASPSLPMTLLTSSGRLSFPAPPEDRARVAEPPGSWEVRPAGNAENGVHDLAREAAVRCLQDARSTLGDRVIDLLADALSISTDLRVPLPAGAEHSALEALHSARSALQGVDFCTRLDFSAVADGPGFKSVLQQLPVSPQRLDRPTRERIDARMGQRFDEAAQCGRSPVTQATAVLWLRNELFILTC